MTSATDASQSKRTQALCWLLDEVLDAEEDLLALATRPGALTGWRRERLVEFCQRVGEADDRPAAAAPCSDVDLSSTACHEKTPAF